MTQEEKKARREAELNYAASTRPQYAGSYDKELDAAYSAIAGRGGFEYDAASDALYKHYKDNYIRQGRLAMRDTVGRAAALTGGYGSSYAENVGRQSYDAYLEKLGAVVPELYTLAYSRYRDEGDDLRERYDMLEGLRDREYKEYTDALDDYNYAQEQKHKREQEEQERAEAQKQKEYDRAQNEAAARAKYGDFGGYASLYGDDTAERMRQYWIAANPDVAYGMGLITAERYYAVTGALAPGQAAAAASTGTSSSKRSGSYYPNTAPDGRDATVVQRELRNKGYNIAVDGAWGPRSQKAWEKEYGSGKSASAGAADASGTTRDGSKSAGSTKRSAGAVR